MVFQHLACYYRRHFCLHRIGKEEVDVSITGQTHRFTNTFIATVCDSSHGGEQSGIRLFNTWSLKESYCSYFDVLSSNHSQGRTGVNNTTICKLHLIIQWLMMVYALYNDTLMSIYLTGIYHIAHWENIEMKKVRHWGSHVLSSKVCVIKGNCKLDVWGTQVIGNVTKLVLEF